MLLNLISLMFFLGLLGAVASIPLILWLGAAVVSTGRQHPRS